MSASGVACISCFLFLEEDGISFSRNYLEQKSSLMSVKAEYTKDGYIQEVTVWLWKCNSTFEITASGRRIVDYSLP